MRRPFVILATTSVRLDLRDSAFRLWVVADAAGALNVLGAIALEPDDVPAGHQVRGAYVFDHGAEAMTWQPAVV